jgi:ketosteroid isomerase-like protein
VNLREGAVPEKLHADLRSLIDTVSSAFNSEDSARLKSVYGPDAVIVDGFAPFRWAGPEAFDRWWADAKAETNERLIDNALLAWGVDGDRAYTSISATLSITLKKGDPSFARGP